MELMPASPVRSSKVNPNGSAQAFWLPDEIIPKGGEIVEDWEMATAILKPSRFRLTHQLEFVENWGAREEANNVVNVLENLALEDNEGYE
jgi:hypothetical protein